MKEATMAHTDRDRQRWMRNHHGKHDAAGPCTYESGRAWSHGRTAPQYCELCDTLWDGVRYYVSCAAYPAWCKEERRTEREKAKQAMRECRDWDTLSIRYRRPYYD
jgi:hypothetical protein